MNPLLATLIIAVALEAAVIVGIIIKLRNRSNGQG